MKKTIIISAVSIALSFGMISCGGNEQIDLGKETACKLKEAKAFLDKNPDNVMFKMDVEDLEQELEQNREKSGDTEAFDNAIEEHLKECS